MANSENNNGNYEDGEYPEELKKEFERYKEETGKYAVWRGLITEGFRRWKDGEKVYDRDKERISLYISEDTKEKWNVFKENHDYSTISKLIRDSVNYFIDKKSSPIGDSLSKMDPQSVSNISHALKEPLTTIKGFSQLLLENHKGELDDDVLSTIKNIFDQSVLLEDKIVNILDDIKEEYDVLLIEDDHATIRLIKSFFESRGVTCKGTYSGTRGYEELQNTNPKLILLDIILPDVNGYDLCKRIKEEDEFKDIPLYFLTAIPESEVEKKLGETGADGYILKPFDFSDFEIVFKRLQTS